ncbi:ATP-binding protein [Pseudoalteromonas sp.]|uniref:ATP-binding protein n=1 Tax=Pseudoalteromonas sp. TaxID=53249 RepID=UPI003565663A
MYYRAFLGLQLTICVALSCVFSIHATAEQLSDSSQTHNLTNKKVLNVGTLKARYIPYFDIDDSNKIAGIYPAYIKFLAQRLEMQVHYQLFDSITELEQAMIKGRIDIGLFLQLTEARQDYLTLSKPLLTVPRTLLIAKELAHPAFSLATTNNLKLAMFKYDVQKPYIDKQFPLINQFTLERFDDITPALNYRLANARLSDALTNQYLLSQLDEEQFTTLTLDALAEKQWRLPLASHNHELNKTLNQLIADTDPLTLSTIVSHSSQWHQHDKKNVMMVNQQQQNWLTQNPILRYTTLPRWHSITMINEAGEPSGLSISVLKRIATLLGVTLEYIPSYSKTDAFQLLEGGQVDIIPAVLKTKARTKLMNFSEPYLTTSWNLLVLKESTLTINQLRQGQYKIASPNGDYARVISQSFFSNSELITQNNMLDSLALLNKKQVDVVFTTLSNTQTWLEQEQQHHYKLLPNLLVNNNVDVHIGINKQAPVLPQLVNQALEVIGHEELEALSRSWIQLGNAQDIDLKKLTVYSLIATAVFIMVVGIFLYKNRLLKREVSFRRIAQQRALVAEQKLTSITNAIPGAVVQFSITGTQVILTYASQGIEELTPFKQTQLTTEGLLPSLNDFSSLLSEPQVTQLMQAAEQALVTHQGIDFECVLNPPYNHWVNLVAFPVADSNGHLWNGILLEINQRKQHEFALSAEKIKAEQAAKTKSNFLAMMSHEIRTPLSGVISATELLAQSQLDVQQRDDINTIITSANNLLHILNDVLDHSKMENQQFAIEKIPCDLLNILETAIRTHMANAQAKNLQIDFYFAPQVNRHVQTDPTRLQQILSNLISNAVKFTCQGSIAIEVRVLTQQLNKQQLEFKVSDTGLGIAPENQTNLFAPFVQAESSTNRQYGGSGLGLSICKMLVERLEGEINLKSQLGIGSEFSFVLPITAYQNNEQPVVAANKAILLLDDGSPQLELVAHYLTFWQLEFAIEDTFDAQLAWLNSVQQNDGLIIFHQIADIITLKSNFPGFIWTKLCAAEKYEYGADYYLSTNPLLVTPLLDLLNTTKTSNKIKPHTRLVKQLKPQTKAQAIASGRLILVAEDHPTNRKVIKRQIESLGYYADYVENGSQALAALEAQQYNLLITDCHMPVLDGYELTRKLRQRNNNIPIIAFTANALIGEAELCIATGMNGYISKPVSQSTLQAKLSKYLPKVAHLPPLEAINDNPETQQQIVNSAELATMFGSPEAAKMLLLEFIASCKVDLDELNNALFTNDYILVASVAHRLKGAAQMVLANNLSALASALELAANRQQNALCMSHIVALTEAVTNYENAYNSEYCQHEITNS